MDELEISGKRYISSKRAGKENRYHMDYIGQLIRAGKLVGSKVGRTWYVEVESLDAYLGQGSTTQSVPSKISIPIRSVPEEVTHIDYQPKQKEEILVQPPRSSLTYVDDEESILPNIFHTESKIELKKQKLPLREEEYTAPKSPKRQVKNTTFIYTAGVIGLVIFIGVVGLSYYLHDDTVVDAANVYSSIHF